MEDLTKLREQNRQMSIILHKSIDILEQEILDRTKSREDTDKIEKSSEGSTSRSSFEYVASNNNDESSTTSSNGISVLHVLHGLKHIRDVLNGSTKEFNSNILDYSSNNSTEDHEHWEVVDDGISVVSVAGTEDEIASVTKEAHTKQDKSVIKSESVSIKPSSISSSIPSRATSPLPETLSTCSPLPKKTIDNSESHAFTTPSITTITTATIATITTTPATTTTTTNTTRTQKIPKHTPPKPKLKLEDILNDVEKSDCTTPKSSITANSKYSWMIEDDNNSLFNPKRGSISSISSINSLSSYASGYADNEEEHLKKILPTTSSSISSTTQRRSKNPISIQTTSTTTTTAASSGEKIDPLGASPFASKNIEGRDRSESVGSVSSTTSSNGKRMSNYNTNNNSSNINNVSYQHHSITPITPTAVPVEDPLGVL